MTSKKSANKQMGRIPRRWIFLREDGQTMAEKRPTTLKSTKIPSVSLRAQNVSSLRDLDIQMSDLAELSPFTLRHFACHYHHRDW